MSRLLILTVFSTLFISLAAAQDTWCAFEVKVSTPSGSPVPEVPVALIRGRKTTFSQTTTDANGVARLCDAPLENVDINVGFDMCNAVLVGYLAPRGPILSEFSSHTSRPSAGSSDSSRTARCSCASRMKQDERSPERDLTANLPRVPDSTLATSSGGCFAL